MTIENIYGTITARIIESMMFHDQASQMYCFIGLYSYEKRHRELYYAEAEAYKDVCDYYIVNYGKILKQKRVHDPDIIKSDLYYENKNRVSYAKKKEIEKHISDSFSTWRKETKMLYERMYKELIMMGEIASANEISQLLL